ncbi:MAG: glycosyltransferase [Methylococcaceae bacterium]|nr:glycosyltransferase [Methylococcaceae bacterium]
MKPKVSVIVPVFNAEATIRRCIDSILNQFLKEIEVILVDDGSDDNSGKICDSYAANDARVRVIHKVNEGCSAARNDGISAAKGQYLGFIDSDDYIEVNMYSEMYEAAKSRDLDVVEAGFRRIFDDGVKISFPSPEASAPNVTNKIIRKDLVDMYDIRFPVPSHMGEDLAFSAKVDMVSKRRGAVKLAAYNYILTNESVSYSLEKRFDIFDSIDDILNFQNKVPITHVIDISNIIYVHGFDLPLMMLTASPDRSIYLSRLVKTIFRYRRYLGLKHKVLVIRYSAQRFVEFNSPGVYRFVKFAKGLFKVDSLR